MRLILPALLSLSICSTPRSEGEFPGECWDASDNDGDDLVDCDDPDCASLECDDVVSDTDTDTDSDTGPYTYERFSEEYGLAICRWTVECYPDLYASVQACLDDVGDPGECVNFDPSAAGDCVVAVDEMPCPAEGEFPEFPVACADVCEQY